MTDAVDRHIARLAAMGIIRAPVDERSRARFAALGEDGLAGMVSSLERGLARAETMRTPVDDGGARRALARARFDDALDRLSGIGRDRHACPPAPGAPDAKPSLTEEPC